MNADHPGEHRTVWEQYPKLFRYLAEGAPENSETVLTVWEFETGRADQKTTIGAREVIFMTRLETELGRKDLDPALEASIRSGELEPEPRHEDKPVQRGGIPVLYFEKGLLEMVME